MTTAIDIDPFVNAIGDAIIVSDAAGAITVWNPAAERMFGFTRTEALGQSLDLIIPERQRKRHWDGYEKTKQTGETRYGSDLLRVPALHKDGHTLSIAFTVALLRDAGGAVTGIVALVRDETSRWKGSRSSTSRTSRPGLPARRCWLGTAPTSSKWSGRAPAT